MFDFIISGYNNDDFAVRKYEYNNSIISLKKSITLNNPSFVLYKETLIFTYSKNPLNILSINKDNLEIIDNTEINLGSMTHLVYSPIHHKLFGASYLDGALVSFDYINNLFSNYKCIKHKELYGENSKCHCVLLNEEESILCCVNIGTDSLYFYDISLNLIKIIKFKDGCGPRHAIWIKDTIYVVTEYSNELIVASFTTGVCIYHSTLKEDFKGISYGATLFYYNNKIYVSNRGEESIAVFDVLENNDVLYNHCFSCNGIHPRHMDHYNNILISCNKNSNNVSLIDLNSELEIGNIEFPNAAGVCILD